MDRSWMYEAPRPGPIFLREVSKFIEAAAQHARRERTTDAEVARLVQEPTVGDAEVARLVYDDVEGRGHRNHL